jgi:uncharacterized membrane protein
MTQKSLRLAWQLTCAALGGWSALLFVGLVPVVGFGLHWLTAGRLAMLPELQVWLIYGLAATGVVFLGLFLVNLIRAPYLLWQEERDAHERTKRRLDRPNQLMRERIAETLASSRIQLADGLSTFNHFVLSYEAEENHKPNAVFVLMRQMEPMNSLKERFMGDGEFAKLWDKHYSEALAWFFRIPVRSDYEDHGEFLVDMLRNDYTDMNKSYRALMDWLLASPGEQSEPQ